MIIITSMCFQWLSSRWQCSLYHRLIDRDAYAAPYVRPSGPSGGSMLVTCCSKCHVADVAGCIAAGCMAGCMAGCIAGCTWRLLGIAAATGSKSSIYLINYMAESSSKKCSLSIGSLCLCHTYHEMVMVPAVVVWCLTSLMIFGAVNMASNQCRTRGKTCFRWNPAIWPALCAPPLSAASLAQSARTRSGMNWGRVHPITGIHSTV